MFVNEEFKNYSPPSNRGEYETQNYTNREFIQVSPVILKRGAPDVTRIGTQQIIDG